MSKNYEDYKPINPGPPRRRKNAFLTFLQIFIISLLIMSVVFSAVYFVASHLKEKDEGPKETSPAQSLVNPETTENAESETDTPTTDEPNKEEPPVDGIDVSKYTNIEYKNEKIHKGNLVFVSSNYKAVYPSQDELVNIYANRNKTYTLSVVQMYIHKDVMPVINQMMADFAEVSGKKDVMIQTSYRDEQRQKEVYEEYVNKHGEEAAKTAVAKPGESDHNTGLGIALKANQKPLSQAEGYSWIIENCSKYGFVERYPADKVAITGLDYSSMTYLRYVGIPHAEIMTESKLCLEEYIVMIKDNYVFGKKHYEYTDKTGAEYEIYYVAAETEGEVTQVPILADKEYTVSGNNMDGFIVTIKK